MLKRQDILSLLVANNMNVNKKNLLYIGAAATFVVMGVLIADKDSQIRELVNSTKASVISAPSIGNSKKYIQSLINLPGPLEFIENSTQATTLSSQEIFSETNTERQKAGVRELKYNSLLEKSAEAKVRDMFEKHYFEHTSPTGEALTDILNDTGYEYVVAGENLAMGKFATNQEVVDAWMESQGHRANILNGEYTDVGIYAKTALYGSRRVTIVVQHFGKSVTDCPHVLTTLKKEIDEGNSYLERRTIELKEQKEAIEVNFYKDEAAHDAAVNEYNASVNLFNVFLKSLTEKVEKYNDTVKKYNSCIGY